MQLYPPNVADNLEYETEEHSSRITSCAMFQTDHKLWNGESPKENGEE